MNAPGLFLCLLAGLVGARGAAAQTLRITGSSPGQDVIAEAVLEDDGDSTPLFRALWRQVPDGRATFELQRMGARDPDAQLMLDRLIEAGIGAYLDARVHFTKSGVKADQPAAQLTRDINGMISAALEALSVDLAFPGLSTSTQQQLDRLTRIDWSKASFGVDGGADQDKYLAIYYYVRSQREELERQVRADLLPLSTVAVIGPEKASPGTTIRINSTCGTVFDEENFLCALDLRLADTSGGLGLEPKLTGAALQSLAERAAAPSDAPPEMAKVRRRDRWLKQELDAINQRIDKMDQRKELWELRDRMDDFDDRLTGLQLEVKEVREGQVADNPSANLAALTGRNITVRFERNSIALESDQRVLLNEVFEQLARSPQDKVLVTGYTDRSGDPARNLWLSEQRAKAVRNYLLARGISAERLLVNYYGDSRSLGRDPGERRVEVEWIR